MFAIIAILGTALILNLLGNGIQLFNSETSKIYFAIAGISIGCSSYSLKYKEKLEDVE